LKDLPHWRSERKFNKREGMNNMEGEGIKIFLEVDGMLTQVVTVVTAAYHLKYHPRTIQRWCDEGKLIAWNVDGRLYVDAVQVKSVAVALDTATESVAS
jgi:hypothetical protein